MKEKLASAWLVPVTLTLLITVELLAWWILGAIPALIIALIAIQVGMALFALWLAQRQRRHAAQAERSIEQRAGRIERASSTLKASVTRLDKRLTETDSNIRTVGGFLRDVLELNTAEIRRLAQLPSNSEPHPTEIRILDELTEVRIAINELYAQVGALESEDRNFTKESTDEFEKGAQPTD